MKKLLFVALAAVGMTACVQNEELAVAQPNAKIEFANAYVSNASRTANPVITTANLDGFKVWSFMDQVGGTVLEDEAVTKVNGVWGYTNIQYWFPGHTYYFAALAPINGNWSVVPTTDVDASKLGLGVVSFTNVEGIKDLLYAKETATTRTIAELTNNGMDAVNMQFQHLLSKVRFTFQNGFPAGDITVKVSDVTMTAPKSGTIDLAQATYNDAWVLGQDEVTLEFGAVADLAITEAGRAANERFSIPATDAYEYNVNFHVQVYQGAVLAYELDKEAVIKGHALEMGKAYNFTAVIDQNSLNLHKIEFTAEVDEWVDANNPETEIPVDYYVDTVGNYVVATEQGLQAIAEGINEGTIENDVTIVLNGDIDLSAQRSLTSNWTPLGTSKEPFTGVFDGQGYTIKNLVIDGGSNSNIGFFGYTTNGEIKNLTIENAIVSGRLNVGVVAGTPYTSKYSNITVKGHVEVNGMAYVGAVGGKNAYANWNNITVNVDETSYVNANSVENGNAYRTYVGGVIGFCGEGGHTFSNIYSNIDVKGSTCDVGGIVGIAHYSNNFVNCVCEGDVEIYNAAEEADAQEIGGIAGVWNNTTGYKVTFTNCSFTGELKANNGYVINTNKFGKLVCSEYSATGAGVLVIDGKEYVKANGDYVTVGSVVTVGGAKVVVYSATKNEVKAVSVEELNLNGKNWQNAIDWAAGLGEGFALASIYELDAIHTARVALNAVLAADNAENALFEEHDYMEDGKVALYLSSTEAVGNDPQGVAYFSNRVLVKYFNLNGYWDYPYSTFASISKYAPLKSNHFARATVTLQ